MLHHKGLTRSTLITNADVCSMVGVSYTHTATEQTSNPSSRITRTLHSLESKLFIPRYPSHHHPTSCFYESDNFRDFL